MKLKSDAEMIEEFAWRLRVARIAAGIMTARAFAKQLGIDENSYTYERAISFPRPRTLAGIKSLTNVTFDWLIEGDESNLTVAVRDRLRETEATLLSKRPKTMA